MSQPRIVCEVTQGHITVSQGYVMSKIGLAVREFRFDLVAKWAEISAVGSGPGQVAQVYLDASKNTQHCDEERPNQLTVVEFFLPKGWSLLSAQVNRYTLSVMIGRHPEKWKQGKWLKAERTNHNFFRSLKGTIR